MCWRCFDGIGQLHAGLGNSAAATCSLEKRRSKTREEAHGLLQAQGNPHMHAVQPRILRCLKECLYVLYVCAVEPRRRKGFSKFKSKSGKTSVQGSRHQSVHCDAPWRSWKERESIAIGTKIFDVEDLTNEGAGLVVVC